MLMTLGWFGSPGKPNLADAHDAWPVWAPERNLTRLMLMMLCRFGRWAKPNSADAHDAGKLGPRAQPTAADEP